MNTKGALISVLLLLSVVLVLPAGAQAGFLDQHVAVRLDVERGLPCNYVDDVLQDSDGFIWIATSGGGLCRFDGYGLLTFNTSTIPPLRSNFIRNIAEDGFHRLWVGSEGGIDVLDLATLEKADIGLPAFSGPDAPFCQFLKFDSRGAMWVMAGSVIRRISFDARGTVSEIREFTHPGLHAGNYVFEEVDGDGCMWASLGGLLHKICPDPAGGLKAQPVATTLDLGASTYVSGFESMGSSVWISTENGLYLLHRHTGQWKQYEHSEDPHSLTQNFTTGVAVDFDGQVVVSTLRGWNVYNPVEDRFERVGSDVVNCVKCFGQRLVLGTETAGLIIFGPKRLAIRHFSNDPADPGSLASGPVNAIWEDPEGRLWVGTQEGGLSILAPGSSRFVHLTRESGSLSHNSVSELIPGPDGQVFVGTWGHGVDVLSTRPPFRRTGHLPPLDTRTDYIGALEYDAHNGLLWICSNQGIFLYDPVAQTYESALDETASGCIGSLIDSSGRLWVGCLQGLYVFDLMNREPSGRFPYVHYRYKLDAPDTFADEKICAIMQASDSVFYLASNGSGIYRALLGADGHFSFEGYTTLQGLSNDRARGLCQDASGRIWVSTEHGLNVLDPASGSIMAYRSEDGVYNTHFFWNAACQGSDGRLYFGHTSGFSVVDPLLTQEDLVSGPLRFTRVEVDGHRFSDPNMKSLKVHQRDRSILFQFSFLTPDAPARVKYKYMLEGYDNYWLEVPAGRHEASYSSLPPGRHTFHVQALSRTEKEIGTLSMEVNVRPYIYNTWWFRFLILFFVLSAVWWITTQRTITLRRRQAELEAVVKERTREISEKAEELDRQNAVLLRQNEELASRTMLQAPDHRASQELQDDPFVVKLVETVRRMYKDPELDVTALSKEMGMSKTLLNTRLQDATGKSTGQFIRSYRLSVAKEILRSDRTMNVSEVAYEVGFNDPKYFTRCFTKEFGVTPSSLAKL